MTPRTKVSGKTRDPFGDFWRSLTKEQLVALALREYGLPKKEAEVFAPRFVEVRTP